MLTGAFTGSGSFGTGMLLVSAVVLALGALHDVAFRTIPNTLCAILLILGGSFRTHQHDLLLSLLVAGIVFASGFGLWLRGFLGGGDVKLLAAASLLVGAHATLRLLVLMSLAGGVLALLYLLLSYIPQKPRPIRPKSLLARILRVERRRIRRRASIPYGVAIAAGAALSLSGVPL